MPQTKTLRSYGDACRTAHALDLIGDRWALLVVRELVLGPKRFTDLAAGLPRATPDMLSKRLSELEREGVVRRRKLGPPSGASIYELTEWGARLGPVLTYLARWAGSSPSPPRDPAFLSPDALVLALFAHFDAERAEGIELHAALQLGEQRFHVEVADGHLEIAREDVTVAEATIEADPLALSEVLWGGGSIAAARKAGDIRIEGDEPSARRLLSLFPDEIAFEPAGAPG